MIESLPPLSGSLATPPALSGRAPRRPAQAASPLPSSPPPELAAELDVGAQAAKALGDLGLTLHFEVTNGEIHVQMLDREGRVVREVPPGGLLDLLASGGRTGLVVDTTT